MIARLMAMILVLAASGAAAQTQNNYLDGLRSLDLKITNAVEDECWPSPHETRQDVQLELIQSEISYDKNSNTIMEIAGVGFATRGGGNQCVLRYDLIIRDCVYLKLSYAKKPKFACYTIWRLGATTIVAKAQSQSHINKGILKLTRKFLFDLELDRLGKKQP